MAPEIIKRHSWLGVCLRMGWNPSLGQFNREHNDKVCPKCSNKPMVTPMVSDLSEVQLRSRAQWTCRNREASVAWRKHHQGWRFPEIKGIFEKDNSCLWQEIDGTKSCFFVVSSRLSPLNQSIFHSQQPGLTRTSKSLYIYGHFLGWTSDKQKAAGLDLDRSCQASPSSSFGNVWRISRFKA